MKTRNHSFGFFAISANAVLAFCLSSGTLLAAPRVVASFPATGQHSALSFAIEGDVLVAASCRAGRCDWANAATVPAPREALALVDSAAFQHIDIGKRRSIVRVRLSVEERLWEALVVAPLGPSRTPTVAFSDWTSLGVDDEGELTGRAIETYPKADGGFDVVVGKLDAAVSLCGRKTLLDPKVLYSEDLKLHRIKLQRLPEEERKRAPDLAATEAPANPNHRNVSRARVASSGKGSPVNLSDGDESTTWSEDRGGDGQGEFVVFNAPSVFPLETLYWTYPERSAPASDAATPEATAPAPASAPALPTQMWVATDRSLFRVHVDPTADLYGKTFQVALPDPETTTCVALVLEAANAGGSDVDVTLAEFGARASIDQERIFDLIATLDDPATDAAPSVAALTSLGELGVSALRRRYQQLSPLGRARTLEVYDGLPCDVTALAYARAVKGDDSAEDRHALERLADCGPHAIAVLSRELQKSNPPRTASLAPLLSSLSPEQAITTLVPLLGEGSRGRRRELREAVASLIANVPSSGADIATWFDTQELPNKAALDLARALGARIVAIEPAAARLERMLENAPEFRERYLLLEPARHLALTRPALADFLRSALRDDGMDPIRARAARIYPTHPTLITPLLEAIDDPHVRVREAAISNLGEHAVEAARAPLLRRLETDPWPMVRAASVRALQGLAPSSAIDAALARRAELDASPHVKRPALLALGARAAKAYREMVQDRLNDETEDPYVRAAAAATLGSFCDLGAIDALSGHAKRLSRLTTDEATHVVGMAALSALGRIAPPDLDERLAVFGGDQVPIWSKHAAEAARNHPERCER